MTVMWKKDKDRKTAEKRRRQREGEREGERDRGKERGRQRLKKKQKYLKIGGKREIVIGDRNRKTESEEEKYRK